MRLILFIFVFFSSVFNGFNAYATQEFPRGDFSELTKTGTGIVTQIISPDTVGLRDGRIIHLTGLEFPDLYTGEEPGPFAQTAQRVLNDMLLGQEVAIYQTADKSSGRINRMGHHLAHLERTSDGAWIQGSLAAINLGMVRTTLTNREMAPQLYILEMGGRQLADYQNLPYEILTPETITPDHYNQFQIVQGTVKKVAMSKNRTYLNFGDDWRTDFTVSIAPEYRKVFEKSNIDPMSYEGKDIRVRGWLDYYNGPTIEIDHPERVEVLSASP